MKYLKIFALVLSCLLIAKHFYSGETHPETKTFCAQTWSEVVAYAHKNLPTKGQLMVKSDGFSYVKVDDEYIHTLFPMLCLEKGFREPPYFRSEEAPGAHISVFYANENINPQEVGQFFHFDLKKIVVVKISPTTSYAILVVESPELEKLREKYGLSPKLFGHEFHISLAKKTSRAN